MKTNSFESSYIDPVGDEEHQQMYAEMEAEVASFQRSYGLIPIGERLGTIFDSFTNEERERWLENEEMLAPLEAALKVTPEIGRLRSIQQLGGKTIQKEADRGAVFRRPAFHTRYEHSELLANLVKAAAVRLPLDESEIKAAVAGAWLHDIGHSSFSHVGDDLLVEKGWSDHEERSIQQIEDSAEISTALAVNNTDPGAIASSIREEGAAGTVQSIMDTLSYLIMDGPMVTGEQVYEDGGAALLSDIHGIDRDRNLLIVKTPELWQEVLEKRARLMKEIYYNPENRVGEEACRQLLRTALNGGYIKEDEVAYGTDSDLRLKLQSLVQRDPGAARLANRQDLEPHLAAYKDLYSFSLGFEPDDWSRRLYDTKAEAISYLSRLAPEIISQSFIVSPFDYTKKKLRLLVDRGHRTAEEITFKAERTVLGEEDKMYIVFHPGR